MSVCVYFLTFFDKKDWNFVPYIFCSSFNKSCFFESRERAGGKSMHFGRKRKFWKKYFWYGVAEDSCRKLSRMYEDMPYQSPLTLLYLDPKKEKNNFGRILSKKERWSHFPLFFPQFFFIFFVKSKHCHAYVCMDSRAHSDNKNTLSPRTQSHNLGISKHLLIMAHS